MDVVDVWPTVGGFSGIAAGADAGPEAPHDGNQVIFVVEGEAIGAN